MSRAIVARTRRFTVLAALLIALLPHSAVAQGTTNASSVAGVWRGSSVCLVRPSPCHDETVVYHIARLGAGDSLTIDARKIVNGQEEEMAVLACRFDAATARIECGMRNGVWRFAVKGDHMVGELRLPDGTKFRDVRVARDRE